MGKNSGRKHETKNEVVYVIFSREAVAVTILSKDTIKPIRI